MPDTSGLVEADEARHPSTARAVGRWLGACLVATLLVVGAVATPVAADGETTVRLSTPIGIPEDRPTVGENVTVLVVASNATDGVGSYDVTVSLADTGAARIVDAVPRGEPRSTAIEVGADAATASAIGADTRDGSSVVVAEVVVRLTDAGAVDLTVTVDALGDERGRRYTVTGTAGLTLSVEGGTAPDVTDDGNPATDPDGDGLYEDVNGDGEVTPGDATVLFNAVFDRDPAVMGNAALFDFTDDGDVTPGDATVLFGESFG